MLYVICYMLYIIYYIVYIIYYILYTSTCRRCGRSGGGRMYKEIDFPSLPSSFLPFPLKGWMRIFYPAYLASHLHYLPI